MFKCFFVLCIKDCAIYKYNRTIPRLNSTLMTTIEAPIDTLVVRKRRGGRPRIPDELRKKPTPRKAQKREVVDNKDKLQCFRCLVWLPKDKYKLKNSGNHYKNCIQCIEYMKRYRLILKNRRTEASESVDPPC